MPPVAPDFISTIKMLTILKWLAAVLLSLLMLVPVVFFAVNWADEELSPEGQALLRGPAARVADADNGYFVLLGMDAPADANALEAGRKVQATRERMYQEDPLRQSFASPGLPPVAGTSPDLGFEKVRCAMQGGNCVGRYLASAVLVREQLQVHAVALGRYRQMMGLAGYEERTIPSPFAPLLNYEVLSRAAELQLAGAVLDIREGREQEGLATLAAEITYHRRLLATAGLLTRMVSAALLRRDFRVLSEVIESRPDLVQSQQELLRPLLAPLNQQENDLRPAMAAEARSAATMLNLMLETMKRQGIDKGDARSGRGEDWFSRKVYLPNSSINALVPYWSAVAELVHGSPAGYEERKQQYAQSPATRRKKPFAFDWTYVRNPMGKIMSAFAKPDVADNIERVHDLDGYIRLVALQAAIRREQIPPVAIGAYVDLAAANLRNPYTGAPMGWDAASSSLLFEGHQRATSNPATEPKTYRVRMRKN